MVFQWQRRNTRNFQFLFLTGLFLSTEHYFLVLLKNFNYFNDCLKFILEIREEI